MAAAGRGELAGLVAAAAGYVFDLAAELPVRGWLFALSEGEHVLLLLCHHIVGDGWSLQVLISDLAAAYAGESHGLLIVHQVCDLVELRSGPGGTAIRLHMRLST